MRMTKLENKIQAVQNLCYCSKSIHENDDTDSEQKKNVLINFKHNPNRISVVLVGTLLYLHIHLEFALF